MIHKNKFRFTKRWRETIKQTWVERRSFLKTVRLFATWSKRWMGVEEKKHFDWFNRSLHLVRILKKKTIKYYS